MEKQQGIQQSPAVGRAVMELILYGKFKTIQLDRFRFERLLDGKRVLEQNIVWLRCFIKINNLAALRPSKTSQTLRTWTLITHTLKNQFILLWFNELLLLKIWRCFNFYTKKNSKWNPHVNSSTLAGRAITTTTLSTRTGSWVRIRIIRIYFSRVGLVGLVSWMNF